MYNIITSDYFLKRSKKFFQKHPELREKFVLLVNDMSHDPFQPHLKLHALKGRLSGLYAVRLTFSFRITLTLQFTNEEITLLDIGSHDEVY